MAIDEGVRGLQSCSRHFVSSGLDLVPAHAEHAAALAPILRDADRDEVAAFGFTPVEGLEVSLASSLEAWCWRIDGVPACLFGIGAETLLGGIGVPWLLGSDLMRRHWPQFLYFSRPVLAQLKAGFRLLRNWVDARNRLAIRWLAWLGFTLHPAGPFGSRGLPHHCFEMPGGLAG